MQNLLLYVKYRASSNGVHSSLSDNDASRLAASKFGRYRGVRIQGVVLKREREGGRERES